MLPGHKYTVEEILGILWRRKWLIAVPLVVCAIGTYVFARRLPDLYRSETLILVVPQKVPESYVRSTVSGTIEDRLQSLQEQILSRSRLETIINDLNLYANERRTQTIESVVSAMRGAVKVDIVRGGEAFSVSFQSRDPREAKNVTERLASLFIQENVRDRETLAVGTSEFLQTQLDAARQRLIEQERKVETYRLKYAGELPTQAEFNLQGIQSARTHLQAVEAALSQSHERQTTLERQLSDLLTPDAPPPSIPGAVPSPALADNPLEPVGVTAREQLEDGRRKLAALERRGFKPEHPDVAKLRRLLADLESRAALETSAPVNASTQTPSMDPAAAARDRRAREIRFDLDAVKRGIATLENQQRATQSEIATYQSRLDAAPIRDAELTELTRDYDTMQQIYRGLLTKREDSKVAANLEQRQVGQQFRVLDPARVPSAPFSPNRRLINLIGVAAGLGLGLGIIALLEYLDTTLKTEDDVRAVLGLPVIATVPILPDPDVARSLRTRVVATLRG